MIYVLGQFSETSTFISEALHNSEDLFKMISYKYVIISRQSRVTLKLQGCPPN